MICKIYELNELQEYEFVVVLSKYHGNILLSRHKKRTTWETQGGHIEEGETPLEAAKRELYEESGAEDFAILPLCDYWAGKEGSNGSCGMVFTADIYKLSDIPDSEMAEVKSFSILPENLTYPEITPALFAKTGCFFYRKAGLHDLDALVDSRIEVLRAANKLSDDVDLLEVREESRKYYSYSLQKDVHIAYLVYDADKVIGAGGISYYQVMPTYHNVSGRKAYIMNMYTHPDYRRKGIAAKTLDLLVDDAKKRGISQISLEATDAGRPLYETYGFVQMRNEMELCCSE